MRSTTSVPAVLLLGLAFLSPPGAGAAAAATCHGMATTPAQVDASGSITGTDGNDVIVSAGAGKVRGLGGDDIICVTGFAPRPFIDAGPGNDVVDATAASHGAWAILGPGADRYDGSAERDIVHAGSGYPESIDAETDDIDTGRSGGEDDWVVSGRPGSPNADRITMGRGRLDWDGIATQAGLVDGGAGSQLGLDASQAQSLVLDNIVDTAVVDGQLILAFTGFSRFHVTAHEGPRSFVFRGSDYVDELSMDVFRASRGSTQDVTLGRGNDRLVLRTGRPAPATTYDAGPGRHDAIELVLPDEKDVDLDLRRGRLSTGVRSREVTVAVPGFEQAKLMAEDVEVTGTDRANTIRVHACQARVDARGGVDQVRWIGDFADEELMCLGRRARFLGGNGRDVIWGSPGPDRLIGGRDEDLARGRRGHDVCQAEKTITCEVRL